MAPVLNPDTVFENFAVLFFEGLAASESSRVNRGSPQIGIPTASIRNPTNYYIVAVITLTSITIVSIINNATICKYF